MRRYSIAPKLDDHTDTMPALGVSVALSPLREILRL